MNACSKGGDVPRGIYIRVKCYDNTEDNTVIKNNRKRKHQTDKDRNWIKKEEKKTP